MSTIPTRYDISTDTEVPVTQEDVRYWQKMENAFGRVMKLTNTKEVFNLPAAPHPHRDTIIDLILKALSP